MLKITTVDGGGGRTLRLEGRLIGPWVEELARACAAPGEATGLTLDLERVAFVDRRAAGLLQGLRERGVRLRGCSPFLREQLRAWSHQGGRDGDGA